MGHRSYSQKFEGEIHLIQQEESDDDVEVDDVLISSEATAVEKEDVVEVSGTEEVKVIIHVKAEEILETTEQETIPQQVAASVDETVQSEEDSKAVQTVEMTVTPAKTELEVDRLKEEQLMVMHEEVRDLMTPKLEKDPKEISSILAEDSCCHEEIKPSTGHQEVRDIDLETDMTTPEERKWAIALPEEVKEPVMPQEVEEAIRTEEAKDFVHLKEACKLEGQREALSHAIEGEIMAQHEAQTVEVEQAQFRILDEDIAPEQNRYMLGLLVLPIMCLM